MNLSKEDIPQPEKVKMEDLLEAIKTTKCSPGLSTERYKKWVLDFGSLWINNLFIMVLDNEITLLIILDEYFIS